MLRKRKGSLMPEQSSFFLEQDRRMYKILKLPDVCLPEDAISIHKARLEAVQQTVDISCLKGTNNPVTPITEIRS